MARKRMIDPSFWTDEKLGNMQPIIRLLFMGLISNADDEGRLVGHPALVRSQVFPYDRDITIEDVEGWLIELHDKKSIIIYSVNNQTYIEVKNFKKFQKINRPTPSQLPSVNELTECSLNTHEQLTDSSRPREEKRREEKRKEIEEKEKEESVSHDKAIDILKFYESRTSQSISAHYQLIVSLVEKYSLEDIKEALEKALDKKKKDKGALDYAKGILKNWQVEGREETHGVTEQHIESEDREGIGLEF